MTRALEQAGDTTGPVVDAVVAGRYVIEAELARGGMGRVYRARNLSTGARIALKRLRGGAAANPTLLGLFEREYRTLHSLKHPRIIGVYDYGVDAGGAYYTMELLAGSDAGKLAPQPYQQACAYLRDVASSLALLHARRLLHRDVSPHNVRVTDNGRCKLLDFGALTGFGIAAQVVGTPPCIPPEAVRGAPLDQRADLYALGATAYYLLTRRHAYPAKTIADLNGVWQSAVPKPSQYAPGLPPALDALVLSMIHHDPLARPESAAEVIERLNAIAGLPSDDEPQAAASYFWSTALIGREAQFEQIQSALRAAVAGSGSALVVRGLAGVGRSRLLSEACVQAQLAGATVIQVDADRERRENGVALALSAKLIDSAPEQALRAAAPHAPVLLRLLPELEGKLATIERAAIPEAPGEWRGRVQAALAAWLTAVSELSPLVIAVDNLEAADDASVALLATLASEAGSRKLLVMTALRTEHAAELGSGVRFLCELASAVELSPLASEQTQALARAMFGDAPNATGIGDWMHRASGGLVSHCFELATELRRRGIVSYAGGVWVLPQEANLGALPSGITDALQARIARLSPAALELAAALGVHATPLGIELCNAVADALGMRDLFARMDELIENDVLALSGDLYRFRHDPLRDMALERVDASQRKRLHLVMGNALLATTGEHERMARVEAGWHLLRGGEELRGAQLLERTAMGFEIGTGSLQAAIPALEEARKVYTKHGRSLYELLPIVTRLATEGYYSDRRLSIAYADEAFALLRRATGLGLAERLRPLLGRKLSVYAGLAVAAVRFLVTPSARRIPRFSDIFVLLVNCVTTQAGAGAVCLDTEAVRRAVAFIEPLTALGPRHITSAIYDYCMCLLQLNLEQQSLVVTGTRSLLERFADPTQFVALPDYVRQLYRGGALFALGIVETWHDGDDALARANELEALGLRIYGRAAHQIRMLYHAGRGEMEQAERSWRRMELHAVQTGSAWQVEVTVPLTQAVVYFSLGDVVRIKRVSQQIDQLAARFQTASLERVARTARGSYLLLRGSAEEALAEYRVVLEAPPRTFIGWARAVGAQAEAYNQLGRHGEALSVCEQAQAHVRPDDRRYVRMFLTLEVQHALALAGLGRTMDAARKLNELIAAHAPHRSPLTMGQLHEARARVALLHRDREAFLLDLREVDRWYRSTSLPSLIARCELLARQGDEMFELRRAHDAAQTASSALTNARSLLGQCIDERERAELALDMILEEAGVTQGHLFLVRGGTELVLAASRSAAPPARALRNEVAELLERFREDAGATRLETHGAVPTIVRRTNADGEFRTHLLWCVIDGEPVMVGVTALRASPDERTIGFHFLQALASALFSPTTVSERPVRDDLDPDTTS